MNAAPCTMRTMLPLLTRNTPLFLKSYMSMVRMVHMVQTLGLGYVDGACFTWLGAAEGGERDGTPRNAPESARFSNDLAASRGLGYSVASVQEPTRDQ
jgi:hypothetical protein